LRAFHARVELTQAPHDRPIAELLRRSDRRVEQEGELLLSESFFTGLVGTLPRIAHAEIELKRGVGHNEMACYRFDVTLHVGRAPERYPLPPASELAQVSGAEPLIYVRDLPNARIAGIYRCLEAWQRGAELREEVQEGVEPESLCAQYPAYDVSLVQARSGEPTRFDAVLRHRERGPRGVPALPALKETALANQPVRETASQLEAELREHLRATLPEYMVPALFVQLTAFPLTPNQKIDRKALPAPDRAAPKPSEPRVAASNDLERQIAGVWQTVLHVEQVGRSENIFELGANSLLTVQAANKLSTVLGRKVSLVSMFRFPTVAALAEHLAAEQGGRADEQRKEEERGDRRKDAAERRRQLRAERAGQGARDD
jgi:hypothetical protein